MAINGSRITPVGSHDTILASGTDSRCWPVVEQRAIAVPRDLDDRQLPKIVPRSLLLLVASFELIVE